MNTVTELVRWLGLRLSALALAAAAAFLVSDALQATFASPAKLAEYQFGSEAMLSHGGPHYRSHATYVVSGLAAGFALLAVAALVVAASRRPSRWFWSSLVPFGLATVVAAAIMLAAWQHNAQGEIHDEAGVAWLHWLSIGGFWCSSTRSAFSWSGWASSSHRACTAEQPGYMGNRCPGTPVTPSLSCPALV